MEKVVSGNCCQPLSVENLRKRLITYFRTPEKIYTLKICLSEPNVFNKMDIDFEKVA